MRALVSMRCKESTSPEKMIFGKLAELNVQNAGCLAQWIASTTDRQGVRVGLWFEFFCH